MLEICRDESRSICLEVSQEDWFEFSKSRLKSKFCRRNNYHQTTNSSNIIKDKEKTNEQTKTKQNEAFFFLFFCVFVCMFLVCLLFHSLRVFMISSFFNTIFQPSWHIWDSSTYWWLTTTLLCWCFASCSSTATRIVNMAQWGGRVRKILTVLEE